MYECPNHKRYVHGECFNKLNRKAWKALQTIKHIRADG